MMLKKIEIPIFSERLFGVTIPNDNKVFFCDNDRAYEVSLLEPTSVKVLKFNSYELYNFSVNTLGVFDGVPIHALEDKNILYSFDVAKGFVEVEVIKGGVSTKLAYEILSGDWFVCTLSCCGKYVVVAEPYFFECYKFVDY